MASSLLESPFVFGVNRLLLSSGLRGIPLHHRDETVESCRSLKNKSSLLVIEPNQLAL